MQHLFIFSLGPVQEFIASARRSRDLWFGSWLLSDLSKAAAAEIIRLNDGDVSQLVFPAPENLVELQSEKFSVANKIVAIVSQAPAEVGTKVSQAVMRRLVEIRNEAYQRIEGGFDRETANAQVIDLPELFWAAWQLEQPHYSATHARVESLLAARKVTRNFKQVNGSNVPKSSLDGQRESVIPESVYKQGEDNEHLLRRLYGIRRAERLCGVGLLKRHGRRGHGEDRFFSTSHVAALPLLERLTDKDKGVVEQYIEKLRGFGLSDDDLGHVPNPEYTHFGRYDGHLLFEERLGEFFDANQSTQLEEAKAALGAFLKALGVRAPIPYYALLLADGDRMGRVIDHQETAEAHRTVSRSLAAFAASARQIVKAHRGSLVYAGGDDVLAFVPLHTVLQCARALADDFKLKLESFSDSDENASPTLSVGVAVTHHLEPLSDALYVARDAERKAKQVGRNALAVTVSKRSGVARTVAGSWATKGQGNAGLPLDARLRLFIKLHNTDAVPDGAAYELRSLALRLAGDELDDARRFESFRILQRKQAGHGTHPVEPETLLDLERYMGTSDVSVKQLADELIIARLFAQAFELTGRASEQW